MSKEVMQMALEELENCADLLKVFEAPIDSCVGAAMLGAEKSVTAIKKALAQTEEAQSALSLYQSGFIDGREKVLKEALAQQDPVAKIKRNPAGQIYIEWLDGEGAIANLIGAELYTIPQKRTWVGLTIEDKKEYLAQDFAGSRTDAMDWAEKRLKEKNT